jgi:hypothetical protein
MGGVFEAREAEERTIKPKLAQQNAAKSLGMAAPKGLYPLRSDFLSFGAACRKIAAKAAIPA